MRYQPTLEGRIFDAGRLKCIRDMTKFRSTSSSSIHCLRTIDACPLGNSKREQFAGSTTGACGFMLLPHGSLVTSHAQHTKLTKRLPYGHVPQQHHHACHANHYLRMRHPSPLPNYHVQRASRLQLRWTVQKIKWHIISRMQVTSSKKSNHYHHLPPRFSDLSASCSQSSLPLALVLFATRSPPTEPSSSCGMVSGTSYGL